MFATAIAPDIKGHFEAHDEDALINLFGALAEMVLPMERVQRTLRRVPLWGIVFVSRLALRLAKELAIGNYLRATAYHRDAGLLLSAR